MFQARQIPLTLTAKQQDLRALTTAMSGAVGTGNIGGVALAIWTGGPAAIFWIWITAIFGMTTKYVEEL